MVRIEAHLVERPDDAMALCAGAATLPSLGENRKAQEWADRALAISPEDYLVHYNAACTFAVTGRLDAALERLEHVFSTTPRVRSWLLGIMTHDVQLDALRGRPDFQDLLKRLEKGAVPASAEVGATAKAAGATTDARSRSDPTQAPRRTRASPDARWHQGSDTDGFWESTRGV